LEVWPRRRWLDYSGPLTGRVAAGLQRLAVRLTPVATCHSRLTAQVLEAEGLRRRPLISPGLIEAGRDVAAAAATDPADPYLVSVGRHVPDTRVDLVPAALAAARGQAPGLRAVIMGDGPETGRVRAAARAAGVEAAVDYPGFVAQAELDRLLAGAVCLVNPSRREGYGLVIVEAAAHGTPSVVVADEQNAAVELVEPGANGFVAATADPADLADAVLAALDGGPALRRRTRQWYDQAVRDKTVHRTAEGILAELQRRL
jgi:glycosyltransferase involved in cell wall biosynthesis